MKILLLGEFSRLHNSLKEGLIKLGYEVILAGSGDSFKQYPVDINLDATFIKKSRLLTFVRHAFFKITRFDLASIETYLRFRKIKHVVTHFDVVQLINEFTFNTTPIVEKRLLRHLFDKHNNIYILACGDDYTFISYLLADSFPHSTLTPYLKDKTLKKQYIHTLNYISSERKEISQLIRKNIKGIIPVSVEYLEAYKNERKVVPMIPNPINIEKIKYSELKNENVIKIFHGINSANILKKGNQYFTTALDIIKQKYPSKVEITIVQDEPYELYIRQLEKTHILLDQVYAHDQGYNALEAMAMGKVVFTGAGAYFQKYYQLEKKVAINTSPDVDRIVSDLSLLIENPDRLITISKNARWFIEQYHDFQKIAKTYTTTWTKINESVQSSNSK
ncbi:glycosyltransferase family 1 protein [Aquimarina sp. ERC-38]|uniref:glycosyltransferase family 1 protein n=1 Tax=Aquimarina sp. ERC-38 TaxID=2949996 RepID=UPI002246527F|nr:glycosyltransferase family 1 protein [Aquimarina sp. ERC-38]UZO80829.1 glycosyltransferase family 1 protein [Aquimarina sp. ERC-38]